MSWLTDLTSKAETLLNKIDQSAAEKFHELDDTSTSNSPSNASRIGEIYVPPSTESIPNNASPATTPTLNKSFSARRILNAPLVTKSHSADGKLMTKSNSSSSNTNTNQDLSKGRPPVKKQDEMLFEFLNNSDLNKSKPQKPKLSTSSLRSSPVPSSTPIIGSSRSHSPTPSVEINLDASTENSACSEDDLKTNKIEDPVVTQENLMKDDPSLRQLDRISNLELENQLLKNDIQSLNEELSRTMGQLKERQEETEKYKMRYENRRNQQNEDYERIRSEYQNKENDLQEALKAKDSQLAVLRVRIQEVDSSLKEKTNLLGEIQSQNEQLMKDHTDASGVQNVALDSIRNKLEETESQLSKVQQEHEETKSELMNLQEKLINEQNQYVVTIKQIETKHNQEKEKSRDFELKVKQASDDTTNAQRELKDYKDKAARILQAKEKLIASLKQGNASDIPPMLVTELEEVKHERDMIREECNQYMLQNEQLRSDYQELELLHNTDLEDSQQKIESLQSSFQDESMRRQQLEEDIKRYIQESQFSKDELHKVRKSHVAENQQYADEIKKLKNQLSLKQHTTSSQEELENRIRTLTDSLIHKQTVVEALSTEKNSLVLQLERLEKQYYDVQKSLDHRNKERHTVDVDDGDRSVRLQSMQSILPTNIVHNKHWKSTANEFDRFSVRLGVFLRRYPIARLMVLIYMFILHLWVTFVLLTYTPEIHHDKLS